jgi:hypothetical protein
MSNYTTIFEKLLDIIDWNTLKISAYKLDVDYKKFDEFSSKEIRFITRLEVFSNN